MFALHIRATSGATLCRKTSQTIARSVDGSEEVDILKMILSETISFTKRRLDFKIWRLAVQATAYVMKCNAERCVPCVWSTAELCRASGEVLDGLECLPNVFHPRSGLKVADFSQEESTIRRTQLV